ncbi:TPA: hypothetical protein EYN09_20250 [Candidatus Poribacteria bacterium]|nr:hypothetical protein [Candidatus Poribacteria bacterium]
MDHDKPMPDDILLDTLSYPASDSMDIHDEPAESWKKATHDQQVKQISSVHHLDVKCFPAFDNLFNVLAFPAMRIVNIMKPANVYGG